MKKSIIAAVGLTLLAVSSHSAVVVTIFAGNLLTSAGANAPAGTLLQLVDLGPDGVFNPINVGDGSTGPLTQWVSGDDSLLNISFGAVDFSSAAAFDFVAGPDTAPTLNRVFNLQFGQFTAGRNVGIRWFPTIQASAFSTTTLTSGTTYGEFTRSSNPLYGGSVWTLPTAEGVNVDFDSFSTTALGGSDSTTAARASLIVIPEPGSAGLLALGVAVAAARRRRK
jgi:hypothetical protein